MANQVNDSHYYTREGERNKDYSKELLNTNNFLKDNQKKLVTRVLNKNSKKEEFKEFYYISDLRNWIEEVEAKDLFKIDYNKCNKVLDVNDKFKLHFENEHIFWKWFYPHKYNQITKVFKTYKKQLDSSLQKINPLKRKRYDTIDFDIKVEQYKQSKVYNVWNKLKQGPDYENSKKAYLNVYERRFKYNIKNNIAKRYILDEETRYKILKLHSSGVSSSKIALTLGLKYSTVHSSINRFKKSNGNKFFNKYEIKRRYLNKQQLTQIEEHVDKHFGQGDNAMTLANWIENQFKIKIRKDYAYSLLRQFGCTRVKSNSIQYDSNTKSYTLARHLFNLHVIATLIQSKTEIYTLDEFGLYVSRKGNYVYKKPSVSKAFKNNSNYDKKFNICVGCSMHHGLINVQISEHPYNKVIFHEFMIKFRDYIVENQLEDGKEVAILCDDAAFHGWAPTMANIETADDKVSLVHLGGMISMLDPAEYFINHIKTKYRELPNDNDISALESLQQIMGSTDKSIGYKCYKKALNCWQFVLEDVTALLKQKIENDQ